MKQNYMLLVFVLITTTILVNIIYADLYSASGVKKELTLLNEFIDNPALLSRFIIIQIFFPAVFALETFFIKYPFKKGVRVLFLIQSIIAAVGIYFTHFLMTFYVFQNAVQYHLNINIIIAFESVFAFWSFILAISFINKIRVVNFFFDRKA